MYVIVEARTQTVCVTCPEGMLPWNRHGCRDGYIEAVPLEDTDPKAAVAYTLLPPYAQAGGKHEPFVIVCDGNGAEYVSVHDCFGRRIAAEEVAAKPKGRVRIRQTGLGRGRTDDGPIFTTFDGALYHRGSPFWIEACPRMTEEGDAVLDVKVRSHGRHKGGILSFNPRHAWVIERIGQELGMSIRTGSLRTAVGLDVAMPLGAETLPEGVQDFVARGMDLSLALLNSKGLRALSELRAAYVEVHGGTRTVPIEELLSTMESLTGMDQPDNQVGPYEGDGWRCAMEDWSYEDGRGETVDACTEALRRRFVIERVRLGMKGEDSRQL